MESYLPVILLIGVVVTAFYFLMREDDVFDD